MTKNVVVYTLEFCPKCEQVKETFAREGVKFLTKDLEDPRVMADLLFEDIVVREAPVVQIDGNFFTSEKIIDIQKLAMLAL